jgi:hypothetical protein
MADMQKGLNMDGKVRSRLSAKVSLLEEWARDGTAPQNAAIPKGPAALARWRDPTLGLESWTSPNIAAPNGPNADLRLRFDAVLSIFASGQSKRPNERRVSGQLAKVDSSLVAQIVTLSEALQISEAELRRSQHLLRIERERTAALVAQASKISIITGES